jgi:hypothetical protein
MNNLNKSNEFNFDIFINEFKILFPNTQVPSKEFLS